MIGDLTFPAPPGDVVDECGGCWANCDDHPNVTCPNTKSCADTPETPIQLGLKAGSISSYIGPNGDDHERIIGAVIVNTGLDEDKNQDANLDYLGRRVSNPGGEESAKEAVWNWPNCICGCPFWGHGTVNRTYVMFNGQVDPQTPIDDWFNFFVSNDRVFDLFHLDDPNPNELAICPNDPDCQTVAPPDVAIHAPMTCGS